MKILILFLTIVALTYAGQTIDNDIHHGHPQEYFEALKGLNKKKMTIHIVPHTHDDVGWLKTPDQYYSGARDDIQRAGVVYTINGMYDQLMKDPKKKFTYVEMAFFSKWWYEQDDQVKSNVQTLVDEGRLQFVNAGWSMSDEATVHYEDFINNMKAGHDFLKKELNYRPTIGWHVDPFGHHSATAALFSEMGFNSWFFARMDHYDKDKRLEEKSMEWLWRPFNESLGARGEIFTHMMYQHYSAPHGFSYNEFSTDDPIVDDKNLETYNVDEKTEELHDYLTHMAEHYRTSHLLVPFGEDFNFLNAQKMFYNIDKLIYHMNEKYDDMELVYSTPYEYTEAIHKEDIEWPTKYDDLFPYSDGDDAYWTGYFTSRANLKGYVREVSQDLNSHSFILALDYIMNGEQTFSSFNGVFNQMGVLQHHDAVAGTEKQHVAFDYAKTLSKAHLDSKDQFMKSFKVVTYSTLEGLGMCAAHNSTFEDCPTKVLADPKVNEVHVDIINFSNSRKTFARIPVPASNVDVFVDDGIAVDVDIICKGDTSEDCTIFIPLDLIQTSIGEYTIRKKNTFSHVRPSSNPGALTAGQTTIEVKGLGDVINLEITKAGEVPESVLLQYLSYKSYQEDEGQKSGAYIFRTSDPDEKPTRFSGITSYDGYQGKYMNQIRFYGDQVDTIITGSAFTDFVEFESQLKGIPMSDQGEEVIVHLSFDKIKNKGVFYTDSMGLEMQERKVDFRPTWDLNVTQHVSENYYPVNHGVTIKDEAMTLEVLNDRSQGATSLEDGTMEFMIQRRTYKDDSRGVGEALNETNPDSGDGRGLGVNVKHYFRFYNNTANHSVSENSRWMQREIDVPLQYVFGTSRSEPVKKQTKSIISFGDSPTLPDEIKVVYLPQEDGTLYARFQNILDLISDDHSSTINVEDFASFIASSCGRELMSVTEVSNSGLFTMDEMKEVKLKWKGEDYTSPEVDYSSDPTKIELTPQRIRAFVFKFKSQAESLELLISF